MRKGLFFLLVGFFTLAAMSRAWPKDEAMLTEVKRITQDKIAVLAKESIIVNAVKDANKKADKSFDEIKRLDDKWKGTDGIDEWIAWFLSNSCAEYLKEIQAKEKPLYGEIFVMDKQGCLVAETDKTSDYWQGDEDKFIKSFAGGIGAVFIDEPSFDESTQAYLVQVSLPVIDPDSGKAIGAITAGINLEAVAR